jgi:hypothetical protein
MKAGIWNICGYRQHRTQVHEFINKEHLDLEGLQGNHDGLLHHRGSYGGGYARQIFLALYPGEWALGRHVTGGE